MGPYDRAVEDAPLDPTGLEESATGGGMGVGEAEVPASPVSSAWLPESAISSNLVRTEGE